MSKFLLVVLSIGLVFPTSIVWAGTASDIRRPPVTSNSGFPSTGPAAANDATAALGQWFYDGDVYSVRSHEFYDNREGSGGGESSTLAIAGYVQDITWVGTAYESAIEDFKISAKITNDLSAVDLSNTSLGGNSHGEVIRPEHAAWYTDSTTMFDTILTAEFAIDESKPSPGTDVYVQQTPAIVAINHHQSAWYCWTAADPSEGRLQGDFQIPAWNFGDILPGETATVLMEFKIDESGGLGQNDSRWQAIADSLENGDDVLLNRSTSLKVSNWVDSLVIDPGYSYPFGADRSSDSSVFFNTIPEPTTLVNLGMGALMLLGLVLRRRARK